MRTPRAATYIAEGSTLTGEDGQVRLQQPSGLACARILLGHEARQRQKPLGVEGRGNKHDGKRGDLG